MGHIEIGPTEKYNVQMKVYVEPSVYEAVKKYQENHRIDSLSKTVRYLTICALESHGNEE